MRTNERKHWNEQKSGGYQNESKGKEQNETRRREAFEAAQKFTNATERAAETMANQKAEKTNRTTGGERIKEARKTTMKWMGREQDIERGDAGRAAMAKVRAD
jgi:hypothetical protein